MTFNIRTSIEILRKKMDITKPECVGGKTIGDCLAEEMLGMIDNKWAKAEDLEERIGVYCDAWEGGQWKFETGVTILDSWRYEIRVHAKRERGFNGCDICVTEYGIEPHLAKDCIQGKPVTCPHDKSREMTR